MRRMDGLLAVIRDNWAAIQRAPWAFLAVVVTTGVIEWFALNLLKREQIAALEARLSLRDDEIADYKRKLSGATPDEAAARIEALERQVALLSPRRLSVEQRSALREHLKEFPTQIAILHSLSAPEMARLARDLTNVFRSAGWDVDEQSGMGAEIQSPSGLSLVGSDDSATKKVAAAFKAAGILVDEEGISRFGEAPVELVIGARDQDD